MRPETRDALDRIRAILDIVEHEDYLLLKDKETEILKRAIEEDFEDAIQRTVEYDCIRQAVQVWRNSPIDTGAKYLARTWKRKYQARLK